MREATGRLGRIGSVLMSMLMVSFLFAVIHPQGLLALPVLMTLACAFTPWRVNGAAACCRACCATG
jgi:hypothetical protein